MTREQLQGFTAGVLGHTSYRVENNTIVLYTHKDARKLCLALIKRADDFSVTFYDDEDTAITIN